MAPRQLRLEPVEVDTGADKGVERVRVDSTEEVTPLPTTTYPLLNPKGDRLPTNFAPPPPPTANSLSPQHFFFSVAPAANANRDSRPPDISGRVT
eukprot:scaffold4039_cov124-Isochrysis_galbana.AAC.8